jgi:hypothetical protein
MLRFATNSPHVTLKPELPRHLEIASFVEVFTDPSAGHATSAPFCILVFLNSRILEFTSEARYRQFSIIISSWLFRSINGKHSHRPSGDIVRFGNARSGG